MADLRANGTEPAVRSRGCFWTGCKVFWISLLKRKPKAQDSYGGLVYLLLCNKLPQYLAAQHNKHLLSHSLHAAGIQEQLSCVVLAQGVLWGCYWAISQAAIIWRLDWGWRKCLQDGARVWPLAGGLSYLPRGGLSVLTTQLFASLRVIQERVKQICS